MKTLKVKMLGSKKRNRNKTSKHHRKDDKNNRKDENREPFPVFVPVHNKGVDLLKYKVRFQLNETITTEEELITRIMIYKTFKHNGYFIEGIEVGEYINIKNIQIRTTGEFIEEIMEIFNNEEMEIEVEEEIISFNIEELNQFNKMLKEPIILLQMKIANEVPIYMNTPHNQRRILENLDNEEERSRINIMIGSIIKGEYVMTSKHNFGIEYYIKEADKEKEILISIKHKDLLTSIDKASKLCIPFKVLNYYTIDEANVEEKVGYMLNTEARQISLEDKNINTSIKKLPYILIAEVSFGSNTCEEEADINETVYYNGRDSIFLIEDIEFKKEECAYKMIIYAQRSQIEKLCSAFPDINVSTT